MKKRRNLNMIKVGLLVPLCLGLSACSKEMDTSLHFVDPLVLNYKSEVSSCSLIEKIGDVEIEDTMIKDDAIQLKNFIVKCSPVDTTKMGQVEVVFTTNAASSRETKKSVIIRDIEDPVITVKQKSFEMDVNAFDVRKFFEELYTVTDNDDEKPMITIGGDTLEKKAGTYLITITATDRAGNSSTEKVTLTLTEVKAVEPAKPQEPVINPDSGGNDDYNPYVPEDGGETIPQVPSLPDPTPPPVKPSNRTYMFGDVAYDGVIYDISNVSSYCEADLYSSGFAGSCRPLREGNIYIGMILEFH